MPGYWNRDDSKEWITGVRARQERRREEQQGGFNQQAQEEAARRYQVHQREKAKEERLKQAAEEERLQKAAESKTSWEEAGMVPTGEHKLSTQLDRLMAKKGPGFSDTVQGQQLLNYLKRVPASKGGGLGLRDDTFGTGANIPLDEAQQYRLNLLNNIRAQAPGSSTIDYFKRINPDLARSGLTSPEYANFRRQLYNLDIPAYREAFPVASGAAGPKVLKFLSSPVSGIAQNIYKAFTGDELFRKSLDPSYTGEPLDPSLFYNLSPAVEEGGGGGGDLDQTFIGQDPGQDPDPDPDDITYNWDEYRKFVEELGGIVPTQYSAQGGEIKSYRGGGLADLMPDNDIETIRKYDI